MKTNPQRLLLVAGLTAVLALGGCWDDDDDDVAAPPPPVTPVTAVPDSAGASAAAFLTYLLTLGGSDESTEPLTVSDTFAVPADESSEPTPLT